MHDSAVSLLMQAAIQTQATELGSQSQVPHAAPTSNGRREPLVIKLQKSLAIRLASPFVGVFKRRDGMR